MSQWYISCDCTNGKHRERDWTFRGDGAVTTDRKSLVVGVESLRKSQHIVKVKIVVEET